VARHPQDLDTELAADSDRTQSNPGLLRIAWNHKALLLLGAAVGLTLGALNYLRKAPVYQSAAQLLVINKRPPLAITGLDLQPLGAPDDFAAAHLSVIKSRLVLDRTLQHLQKLDFPSLRTFAGADPVAVLTDGLTVARDNREARSTANAVLNLTFNGPAADECPTVLQAVITSYKDFLEATYKDDRDSTLQEIKRVKEQLEVDLKQSKAAWAEFRQKTPFLPRGKDGFTVQQESLADLERQRLALRALIAKQQARLDAIDQAMARHQDPTPLLGSPADLTKADAPDPLAVARVAMDAQLVPLLLEERTKRMYLGKDHPDVVTLRGKIQFIRDYFGPEQAAAVAAEEAASSPTVASRVEKLRQQLVEARRTEATLKKVFDEEREAFQKLAGDIDKEDDLRMHINRTTDMLDALIKRLPDVDVAKDSPTGGYKTEVLVPPGAAVKVEPRAASTFGVALFLGLMLGLGLAWLAEVSDKSFRTPDEIRRRLKLPIVGHIPFLKPDEAAAQKARAGGGVLDPLLCTFYQSKSVHAEAYRGVRTALYFNTQGEGPQVIQVTSPNKGDGKSTMAANLAVSIAQSGKKVLVVDADFRRPRQHKIFGLTGQVGIAAVMAGEAELEAVLQATAVENLFVLPCGSRPANPAELLTSPRFAELLAALRGRFDFVVVDTPPLLAVSDPSVVAPRVDGVLLTIRVSKNGRPQAERAKEILVGLGAHIVGVVVNGVGRQRDGYEDGQYTYGYGYGYSYGYMYSYEPEDAKSYYEEPESGVDLGGKARNGAGAAKAAADSNPEVDLGAGPGRGSAGGEGAAMRRRRPAPPRAPARPGLMRWLRRLWP
jgi:capsular exopolysaccharide synthesis family protein